MSGEVCPGEIAILTYQSLDNYGQRLQNFAVEQIVKEAGYVPVSIKVKEKMNIKTLIHVILLRFRKKNRGEYIKKKRFQQFNKNILNIRKIENFNFSFPNYEYVMTGSDQVWNPYIPEEEQDFFLLKHVEGKKRIAMAPSFGVDNIPVEFLEKCCGCLKSFRKISVREESSCLTLKEMGIPAEFLLDPTLYIELKEYEKIIDNEYLLPASVYLLYMVIGKVKESLRKEAVQFAEKSNMKFVDIDELNRTEKGALGPAQWLTLIKNADLIVTNSFHGAVFSIIYEKNFYAYERIHENELVTDSRAKQLLCKLKLEERYEPDTLRETAIDYTNTKKCLDKERLKWKTYLADL